MDLQSEFIFVVCQVGAEPALKKEILREHPEFRFAFSRPGYLTFKNVNGPVALDFRLRSVLARAFGVSYRLGEVTPDAAPFGSILELVRSLRKSDPQRQVHLHSWERDQHPVGEEPLGYQRGDWLGDQGAELKAAGVAEGLFEVRNPPRHGDFLVQFIAIDPGKFALGAFVHSHFHSGDPGGRPSLELPLQAPSRAYLKLEHALSWSGAPIRKGDIAVEIGSAPGGASFALLERGLEVVGIDPAEMAPHVLQNPNFKHIRRPVAQVPREELPEKVQWVLLDMNVEPNISLYAVDRLATRLMDSLHGVFLTVKLNQWAFADEIPYFMEHVKAIGMVRVKAAQLAYHRQEILIYGLTRRGLATQKY